MMHNSLTRFHHLKYRINGELLLNIDELSLYAGSCCVLSGANGSGKTTLMKIIAGLLKPESAQVNLHNHNIMNWNKARKLLHKHTAYLHQQPFLFDTTVYNNIGYGLKNSPHKRSHYHTMIEEALDWAGLSEMEQRHARLLSGGEKQRLALARAYVTEPAVMLMDEPTANMDQASKAQTYQLIRQLKERGISILISSHEREQI
ncbi:MAG: energy-coupling factor ABC transporter ATP-binding protein, partial [Gammaproteobacteria bacterium]|nr:energy-coupling factor ABC transporter ATP-binding protein [Gammaproteobacteria bacterium]